MKFKVSKCDVNYQCDAIIAINIKAALESYFIWMTVKFDGTVGIIPSSHGGNPGKAKNCGFYLNLVVNIS